MRLIAKVVSISHAKFHCNRLTAVQDIQDYASHIFLRHIVYDISIRKTLKFSNLDLNFQLAYFEFLPDCLIYVCTASL